ncbi:MAG: sigma-70 family RNA polymerase sigma factor [Saprospirales bacterium]|nr:MAG: sigma-70 family RNA polymerase sigma factor [Saprospirales bacterium]
MSPLKPDHLDQKEKHEIFEKELFPHLDALNTFAYHLTYDEDYAKDLVQETYMKAYRFMDKYQKGTNAKAWLFKILKNAYINHYRRDSRRPTKVDFEDVVNYQDSDDDRGSSYFDLREEIFENMMGDEVTTAINSLPVDFRTVILLCDIEGFTYDEISKIVDIPTGTVRSRLFRARNMLKEKLKEYAESLGFEDKRGNKGNEKSDE